MGKGERKKETGWDIHKKIRVNIKKRLKRVRYSHLSISCDISQSVPFFPIILLTKYILIFLTIDVLFI